MQVVGILAFIMLVMTSLIYKCWSVYSFTPS